jgi:hypothetical protein
VERREASVPRYGTQGASLGAWPAASCAGPTGASPSTRTFLGAPPTPRFGVSEAKVQTPGAENAPRERDGLFEIVRWAETRCCPHPEERACRREPAKHERACARPLWKHLRSRRAAMLLSMRASRGRPHVGQNEATRRRGENNQPAAVETDRRLGSPVSGLFFTGNGATPTCRAVSAVRRASLGGVESRADRCHGGMHGGAKPDLRQLRDGRPMALRR